MARLIPFKKVISNTAALTIWSTIPPTQPENYLLIFVDLASKDGKKTKIGKQRKDKYYHLAKEAGYRSRAAFKLIQLNKRFEFLQKSRAIVDLCAAPGGWLQVASQNMPVSSFELVSTWHLVKKELQTWEADCQNCLTLFALRLATQILRKNGYFVTKIFRSSDYQQLVTVFEKLFKKVHVWKPAASRLESAEIFVVCERYLKPAKVDSDLLDVKKVFQQQPDDAVNPLRLLTTRKKEKKAKAEGYAENDISLYHVLKASEFVHSSEALLQLSQSSCITLDSELYDKSPHTTMEIRECIKDIKVCGPAELRNILMWRKKILADVKKDAKLIAGEDPEEGKREIEETPEEKEIREINELIQNAKAAEKSKLRKKKKKLMKEKAKLEERKKLQMVHEGDEPTLSEDVELFSLSNIRRFMERKKNREQQLLKAASEAAKKEEDEEEYVSGDDEDGTRLDLTDDNNWETIERNDIPESEPNDGEIEDNEEEKILEQDLIVDEESHMTDKERTASRSEKWFSRISSLLDDDDEEVENLDRIAKHMQVSFEEDLKLKNVEETKEESDQISSDESSDDEYEDLENGKWVKKRKADFLKHEAETAAKKPKILTPEQLAMGEMMIYSSKTRKDLQDSGWNRYTHNDTGLPDWFVSDENNHCKKILPVTKERIEFYKQRQKELNVRPIKKYGASRKIKEMKKVYKKALTSDKKDIKYQVITKGKRGRMSRPNGPYKVVDKRLKKDKRTQKAKTKKESGRDRPRSKKSRK
uniref:rRNA methyltransferase n=1 Tax=Ditylenchus dipsaci TaxID=166011 RepID=A0A915CUV4_9BILA